VTCDAQSAAPVGQFHSRCPAETTAERLAIDNSDALVQASRSPFDGQSDSGTQRDSVAGVLGPSAPKRFARASTPVNQSISWFQLPLVRSTILRFRLPTTHESFGWQAISEGCRAVASLFDAQAGLSYY